MVHYLSLQLQVTGKKKNNSLKYGSIIHKTHFGKSSALTDAAFSHLTLAQFNSDELNIASIDGLGKLNTIDIYTYNNETSKSDIKHSRTILTLDPLCSTLVPDSLFVSSKSAEYLKFQLVNIPQEMIFMSERISELNAVLVYGIDAHLASLSESILGGSKIYPSTKGLLSMWNLSHNLQSTAVTFIHIEKNNLYISAWKNKKLAFYTQQSISQAEDVVYYTLYSLDQLSDEFNQAPIIWSTSINHEVFAQKSIELLSSYHQNITPFEGFEKLEINNLSPAIEMHTTAKLISSILCE